MPILAETIPVPKEVIRQLIHGLAQVEEALVTIEELANKEGLERVRKARDEYRRGEVVDVESGDALLDIV
jgi:hypothetical protein